FSTSVAAWIVRVGVGGNADAGAASSSERPRAVNAVRFIRASVPLSDGQGRQASVGIMHCKGGAVSVELAAFSSLPRSDEKGSAGWGECATRGPTAQILHSARSAGTAWPSVNRPVPYVLETLSD